ncbi:hypothetical protein AB1Y20_012670 [Prymnesium parvum]|uniref:Uncharacterized protein n=1 Tax=Prymnesium parvum TaxID=97485 RepID=A0AB34IM19_PRYPA
MKRLFESDNQARVGGIQHIPELIAKLTKEFRNEKEALAFEFDFANWDLNSWVMDQKLSGEHSGISSKLVYTYSYDPMLKVHGCVKVQYKNNISWQGNSVEAEYSPIVRVQEEVPTKDGEGMQTVERNVSDKAGVRFVLHPPDLTREPKREQLKTNEFDPAAAIRLLLNKRSKDLSYEAVEHWEALGKLHDQHGRNAEDVPQMPFQVNTPSGSGLTL